MNIRCWCVCLQENRLEIINNENWLHLFGQRFKLLIVSSMNDGFSACLVLKRNCFAQLAVNVGEDCPVFDGLFEFCQLSSGGSLGLFSFNFAFYKCPCERLPFAICFVLLVR